MQDEEAGQCHVCSFDKASCYAQDGGTRFIRLKRTAEPAFALGLKQTNYYLMVVSRWSGKPAMLFDDEDQLLDFIETVKRGRQMGRLQQKQQQLLPRKAMAFWQVPRPMALNEHLPWTTV